MDELYLQALKLVVETGCASMSALQRKLSVGYNKAGKIMEWLEEQGYVSAFNGEICRKVLITIEEFEEKFGELFKEEANEKPKTAPKKETPSCEKSEPTPQDELWLKALKICVISNSASISLLQRKLGVGYFRAGQMIEWLEENGFVSPFDGAKPRKVLITKEEFEEKFEKI